VAPALPIRGREDELRRLSRAIAKTSSGVAQIVLLEGDGGIGKTRLVDELASRASADGFRVFIGRADDLDRSRPFGPLITAFDCRQSSDDPRRRRIARLLGSRSTDEDDAPSVVADPGLHLTVVESLVELLESEALERPVLLVTEDIHWADLSTLIVLQRAFRRLLELPVAHLITFRPLTTDDGASFLRKAREAGAESVTLAPLDDDAVAQITEDTIGASPGERLRAQVAAASGNPLFVVELLRALEDEGAITRDALTAEVSDTSLPPSLRSTILSRIAFLPAETITVLRFASVLGTAFSMGDLAVLCDRPATKLLEDVSHALDAQLLIEDGTGLRFRHELIRSAIYEDLPLAVRRELHSEAGRRLADAGAPAVRVAQHLSQGAEPGDEQAIEWLHRAARETVPQSPVGAAELYEKTLVLIPIGHAKRGRVGAEACERMFFIGRYADAEKIANEVLVEAIDPSDEALLRLTLARVLMLRGRIAEARNELAATMRIPDLETDTRARVQAEASMEPFFAADMEGAAALGRDALAAAEAVGEDEARSLAHIVLALADYGRARVATAMEHARNAASIVERKRFARTGFLVPHGVLAFTQIEGDRLDDAARSVVLGREVSERAGAAWSLQILHWIAAYRDLLSGEWDDCVAEVESGFAESSDSGSRVAIPFACAILAHVRIARGDLTGAEETLSASDVGVRLDVGIDHFMHASALLAEAKGDADRALTSLASTWDVLEGTGARMHRRPLGPDLVRLALNARDETRAHRTTELVEEVAAIADVATARGAALRCRGLLENDAALLLRAVDAYREGPRPVEFAIACVDAAAASRDDASTLLAEAVDIFERVGAVTYLARADALLRDLGVRKGARGRRSRPKTGWESLTPTERNVVTLAVEGLTNPEIAQRLYISPRTVQTHLAHVYAKLGISSRVELATRAERR